MLALAQALGHDVCPGRSRARVGHHGRMAWDFRVRTTLGVPLRISSPEAELEIFRQEDVRVVIHSSDPGLSLAETRDLVIRGSGYRTEDDARRAGERWCGHVMVGFASLVIGADFGDREPESATTEAGLKLLSASDPGFQYFDDSPGVHVFMTDPPARFSRFQVAAVLGKAPKQVTDAVQRARELEAMLDERQRLAYNLFSASFSQPAADASFLMLSMALETLIEQAQRTPAERAQIDAMIRCLKESDLEQDAINSLVGSVQALKRESVGQAGRRLATRLSPRQYLERTPVDFFNYSYGLRSDLVHGHVPRPTHAKVSEAATELQRFVGDLLSAALATADQN